MISSRSASVVTASIRSPAGDTAWNDPRCMASSLRLVLAKSIRTAPRVSQSPVCAPIDSLRRRQAQTWFESAFGGRYARSSARPARHAHQCRRSRRGRAACGRHPGGHWGDRDACLVDQGYTGDKPAEAARKQGIVLEVVKLPEAKRGFVLLPRRWVVERSFAWATRCRRLVKDYERYASTLAGFNVVAFACLMLKQAAILAAGS